MAKVAGSIWIEGIDLHFIDAQNREWLYPGKLNKAISAAKPGSLWIDNVNAFLYYVTETGAEIRYPAPIGYQWIARVKDSLYVGSPENLLQWTVFLPAYGQTLRVKAHTDTPPDNSHNDGHVDVAHVDGAHTDIAHVDGHNDVGHVDYFDDSPHTDYFTDYHDDSVNYYHNDFTETEVHHDSFNHLWHQDSWTTQVPGGALGYHYDQNVYHAHPGAHYDYIADSGHNDYHDDVPHGDYPHGDYHDDQPHQDVHADGPHTDIPHIDASHGDTHTDTHGDSGHQDEPILVGP